MANFDLESLKSLIMLAPIILLSMVLGKFLYNIWLHPLARIPGPLIWRGSRFPYALSFVRGQLTLDVRDIHRQYGNVVRIAPDEVSFADPQAWHDIHAFRPGHEPFAKNPIWFSPPDGEQATAIVTASNADHGRMRGLMEKAFTKRSLEAHEPIVQSYISLFISKLSEQAEKSEGQEGAMVDMVDWLNFLTFDIIGDLGFGESFGCLENSKYHPWVQMIFQYLKGMAFLAATRYFPLMESFLKLLIPRSVMHKQREHFALAKERVHRRMNAEKQRNDFMGPIIAANGNGQYMSIEEIEASFNILIIAGSETSASVLSGLINELIQEPEVMSNLVKEIRTKFNSEAEISLKTTRELEYLNCCLREALRMCNPVPAGLSRVVPPKGDTVCGIWLPAGTYVAVHPFTLSFSPDHFSNPHSFIPERWSATLPTNMDITHHNPSAINPFSLGPRRCLGKDLAWLEMQLAMARLLWNFDIFMDDVVPPVQWGYLKTYGVVERQPVMVRVKRRQAD